MICTLFIFGCSKSIDCNSYNDLSEIQVVEHLSNLDKNNLAVEIHNLGECKSLNSTKAILIYIEDQKVVHHLHFQGMSIQRIANNALNNILDKSVRMPEKPTEVDIKNVINAWERHIRN